MSELYTVRMSRKRLITTYDPHGNIIDDREELIEITFHDLPQRTAVGYQTAHPEANVRIERQFASAERSGKSSYKYEKSTFKPANALVPVKNSTIEAAVSGDMAAAVSAK